MSEQTGGELEWVGLEELKSEDWARPRSGKNMGAWMELSGGLFFFFLSMQRLLDGRKSDCVGGWWCELQPRNQPTECFKRKMTCYNLLRVSKQRKKEERKKKKSWN